MAKSTGQYLQKLRAGKFGLREAARLLKMTHTMLAEIESDEAQLARRFWPAAVKELGADEDVLAELAAKETGEIVLGVNGKPAAYRKLGLALARRIEGTDITNEEIATLMKLLKD